MKSNEKRKSLRSPDPVGQAKGAQESNQDVSMDLESLRLSQDFEDLVGVKKKLVTVPVRKPNRQSFVRVHPEESYRLETAILELKEERETYLVDRGLWPELPGEIVPTALFTAITRQGVVFLWPVRLPNSSGRQQEWHRSALEAAQEAMTKWVRVASNMSLGAYDIFIATGKLPEPEWPDASFKELLGIAFRERFIRSLDHPAVRSLRGEI